MWPWVVQAPGVPFCGPAPRGLGHALTTPAAVGHQGHVLCCEGSPRLKSPPTRRGPPRGTPRVPATAAASAGDPEVPEAPRCSDALGGRCSRLLGPWLRRGSELPPPGCQSVPGHVCLSGRLSLSRAAHRGPPAVPRSAFRAAPRGGPSATLGPTSEAGTFSRSSAPASLSFCHSAPPAASLGQRRASAGRAREAAAPSPSSVCVPCLSLPLSACRSPRLQLSNCSHLSAALSLSVPP